MDMIVSKENENDDLLVYISDIIPIRLCLLKD